MHVLFRADLPVVAAPRERDLGRGLARVLVEALLLVVLLRAVDARPELLRGVRGRGDDRRARVDDRVEAVRDALAADLRRRAADLPEAVLGRHLVVLDLARVQVVVRAADVQLRARAPEPERERTLLGRLLRHRGEDEGVVLEVRDRGEREPEEAVRGVLLELV